MHSFIVFNRVVPIVTTELSRVYKQFRNNFLKRESVLLWKCVIMVYFIYDRLLALFQTPRPVENLKIFKNLNMLSMKDVAYI
jgi:hypothetical protein